MADEIPQTRGKYFCLARNGANAKWGVESRDFIKGLVEVRMKQIPLCSLRLIHFNFFLHYSLFLFKTLFLPLVETQLNLKLELA